ncbi:enoyl-CoA hydratase [Microbacterium sp. HM58-2]|nr:enoyl-CoA hydratase [Microbacterium sp. HM58-2]
MPRMRSRVPSGIATSSRSFSTKDTVARLTPASLAMSAIVTALARAVDMGTPSSGIRIGDAPINLPELLTRVNRDFDTAVLPAVETRRRDP